MYSFKRTSGREPHDLHWSKESHEKCLLTRYCRQLKNFNYNVLMFNACRHQLREDQWERIKDFLPGKKQDVGCAAKDNRLFIEAVIYKAKTGCGWMDLPEKYGKWHSVHKRFLRWSRKGVWQAIFNTLACSADTEWLMCIVNLTIPICIRRGILLRGFS